MSLNAQQQAVIDAPGNVLCCACPGSGKTRTLVEKVFHELTTHPSSRILMTTFTRDAADAMLARVRARLLQTNAQDRGQVDRWLGRLTIGTFHALAFKQLRSAGPVGRFLNTVETRLIIGDLVEEMALPMSVEQADMAIGLFKVDGETQSVAPEVRLLAERYQAALTQRKAQDFTDLMLRANQLMRDKVIKPLPADLALFDEFQDVDRLQFEWMLHTLAQGPTRAIAVGDDDQAIYGFRRSLGYAGMMDFVRHTGAQVIKLGVNYRTTESIVASAAQLISLNLDRVQKQFTAARGAGKRPIVVALEPGDDQGQRLLHLLDGVCRHNPKPECLPGETPPRFGVQPNQVAVLARSNQQLQAIEDVLRAANVPCHRMGRNFWDAPILSVYTTLLAALCKQDPLGVEVALRWANVSLTELNKAKALLRRDAWGFLDAKAPDLTHATPAWSYNFQAFLEVCRAWPPLAKDPNGANQVLNGVASWMAAVITESAHGVLQERKAKRQTQLMQRRVSLLSLGRDQMRSWSGRLWDRLPANRAKLKRNGQQESTGAEEGIPRVVLGTFHGSKGLEYAHVYLIDIVEGSVPKLTENATDDDLAEERRVFYVAMTRAKDELTLFTRKDKTPSAFLMEAGLL